MKSHLTILVDDKPTAQASDFSIDIELVLCLVAIKLQIFFYQCIIFSTFFAMAHLSPH